MKSSFISKFSNFKFIDDLKENLKESGFVPAVSVRKIFWVTSLVLIYIYFQHHIEQLVRRMEKAEVQMKESRASYISQKAAYMYESKHSQISKKMEGQGMNTNIEPPLKIVVE